MPGDNLRNYLKLHLIVFIWGFTAILGKLISLKALDLVWFRMVFAVIFLAGFVLYAKNSLWVPLRAFFGFLLLGVVIAGHWYTFYQAIKVSNISITLACLSTGAFFASLLEPIFYKKKVVWYEVFFGLLAVIGLGIIFNVESRFKTGIALALFSAFLSAFFSVANSKYAKVYEANVISIYELGGGVFFLTLYLLFAGKMTTEFFDISIQDLMWLLLLASVCTAYAFSASVRIMKFLSPYTVMLTINLEPIYGIVLALLIFKGSEDMDPMFYVGALIILATVVGNGILKNKKVDN